MPRYATPRKLQTKRGQYRAEHNPWCLKCHAPMAKHGPHFYCRPCHTTVRAEGIPRIYETKPRFKVTSHNPDTYPYCLQCHWRMYRMFQPQRLSWLFRCPRCKRYVTGRVSYAERFFKDKAIVRLIKLGYPNESIMAQLKCHGQRVSGLRKGVTARRCECGQLFFHRTKCTFRSATNWRNKRGGWQDAVGDKRSLFDTLLIRIKKRIPRGLPEDVQGEVAQMVLLDMLKVMDEKISHIPKYLREYNRWYSRLHSDALEDFIGLEG